MSKVQNDFLKRKKEYDYCTQIWGKTNFIAIEKIMSLSLIFYYCFLYQRALIMIWSTQEILYTRKKLGVNSWFLFADISLRVLRVVADVWTNCLRYSAHSFEVSVRGNLIYYAVLQTDMASARTGNMDHARTNESDHKNLLQETNWRRLLTESNLYTYSSKRCLIPDVAILDISLIRLLFNFLPKKNTILKNCENWFEFFSLYYLWYFSEVFQLELFERVLFVHCWRSSESTLTLNWT